jgi:hypothetical protein
LRPSIKCAARTNSFKYDLGRRIYKSSSSGTSIYAYDGDNLIEETNSSGPVVAHYEDTQNIDEPVAMLRSSATSCYHADGVGSITLLSNSAGGLGTNLYVRLVRQTDEFLRFVDERISVHRPRI